MTDVTRDQLQEIIRWWPLLDDVAESLIGVTGNGMDLAGVHVAGGTSAVEVAIIQLEEIQAISIDLTALARKMGWRAGLDGTARHYVHANLAWARANLAAAELDPVVADIHSRVARLTGHAPRPTGRTCPACGDNQLMLIDNGDLHCHACDTTRTPDEITALTTWRATNADAMVTQTQAANILGIPRKTIHTWIRRGHITMTNGRINISETKAHHDTTR